MPIHRIGLLLLIVAAWCTEGYFHPDEHFQLLEFANWKFGLMPAQALPWEFAAQMRPALQPVIAWIAISAARWSGLYNPFILAFLLRLMTGLLAFTVYKKLAILTLTTEEKPLFFGLVFCCWFMPMLSVRFSSENYAALSFLLACYYLLDFQKHGHLLKIFGAGLALGISFCFRFQMAFAIAGILCWLVFSLRAGGRPLLVFFMAGMLGLSIGLLADRWFYGTWVFTPWNYFRANIMEGKANAYGMEPWWWYLPEFCLKAIPPVSLLILAGLLAGIRKNKGHLLVWALIPFIAGHSIVAHKELRFLFPMVVPVLWLTAQGFSAFDRQKWWPLVRKTALIVNLPLLLYATCIPLQSSVGMFQFLWNYPGKEKIHVFAEKESPFKWVGQAVSFYRPDSLQVFLEERFDNSALNNQDQIKKGDLLISRKTLSKNILSGYQLTPVYQQLPDWLQHFNFNDWQSRTDLWNCYIVE